MIKNISELYGRQMSASIVDNQILCSPLLKKYTPIEIYRRHIHCKRCGQNTQYFDAVLPGNNFYCPQCINLGRITYHDPLCYVDEPNHFKLVNPILTWQGQLTVEQMKCSETIRQVFRKHERHLLWAVTGAGKTEMLFNGVADALSQRKRVCIASPRVDVCVELYPRIKEAFANTSISLLHGRNNDVYKYTQLTVCTTHQLLRFFRAFDVLIIDEVDSFPFVDNPGLNYAARQAVKPQCSVLYLTATPSESLLKSIKRRKLTVSYLPIRFHRHLLPQIRCYHVKNWRLKMRKEKLPKLLLKHISQKIHNHQRFLLFVPRVADLQPVSDLLKENFNHQLWKTVYSGDKQRIEKVNQMRQEQLLFLITTTILERGVTFPDIDVLVLGADDEVFSTSSLVQIAGRVGRKTTRPFGDVFFYISNNTKNIKQARNQIKYMNKLARKLDG